MLSFHSFPQYPKVLKQNSIGACSELLPVGVKVELHPWQVASSSRGHTERQTTIRTYIHTCSQSRVNVHVCWRKPEHQQGTCTKNMHHAVTVFSAALHHIMLSLSAQSISHIWIGCWQMLFDFFFSHRGQEIHSHIERVNSVFAHLMSCALFLPHEIFVMRSMQEWITAAFFLCPVFFSSFLWASWMM